MILILPATRVGLASMIPLPVDVFEAPPTEKGVALSVVNVILANPYPGVGGFGAEADSCWLAADNAAALVSKILGAVTDREPPVEPYVNVEPVDRGSTVEEAMILILPTLVIVTEPAVCKLPGGVGLLAELALLTSKPKKVLLLMLRALVLLSVIVILPPVLPAESELAPAPSATKATPDAPLTDGKLNVVAAISMMPPSPEGWVVIPVPLPLAP